MANKHTNYDLAQMQSLPLSAKINMTRQRIKGWYEYWNGNVYVSVSGGKDSQVLAHIVRSMYDDVPLVFVNTGLEFDSVRVKGIELADEILRPSMDFINVLTKYGYPIISKEVSECVDQARKYLTKECARQSIRQTDRQTDGQTDRQTDHISILTKNCMELENIPIRTAKIMGMLTKDNKIKVNIPSQDRSMYSLEKYKYLINAPFRISNLCCKVMKKKPTRQYAKQTDRKPIVGTMAE